MVKLHRSEREPFSKRGQKQKTMGPAVIQRQDRGYHSVPFHAISMVIVYLIRSGVEHWDALGRCARFLSYRVWRGDVQMWRKRGQRMAKRGNVVDGLGHEALPLGQSYTTTLDDAHSSRALIRMEVKEVTEFR